MNARLNGQQAPKCECWWPDLGPPYSTTWKCLRGNCPCYHHVEPPSANQRRKQFLRRHPRNADGTRRPGERAYRKGWYDGWADCLVAMSNYLDAIRPAPEHPTEEKG